MSNLEQTLSIINQMQLKEILRMKLKKCLKVMVLQF